VVGKWMRALTEECSHPADQRGQVAVHSPDDAVGL
jgi:hypothetical protein